ncbi:MAG: hypothetical protein A2506_09020 [Elusimicrobia bacterium RIFOXYD12_FULL_66_9]|nr:MAG: hypothetical protein A2506_09020 [Elusimicrobia bacterium RIFOXYD12_FULL_66_9]
MTSQKRLRLTILLTLLVPGPVLAQVRVVIPSSPAERAGRSSELADAEKRLRALLADPAERREDAAGVVLHAAAWRAGGAARREAEVAALRRNWAGLRIEEGAPASASLPPGAVVPPGSAVARLPKERLERLLGAGVSRESQSRFYDGSSASGRAASSFVAARTGTSAKGHAAAASGKTLRLSAKIPPLVFAAGVPKPSLSRGAWEAVKGAGGVVKDMISWKGLAVAVGAVALVTVAPVTIYGLLAVGAAVGGWTIGKALLHGTAAYKAGDTARFNEACREFGRGALSLGLALYGARFAPTNLKPHIPRTGGEWKALSTSMDDESVVLFSLFRGKGSNATAEVPKQKPPSG